MSQFAQMNQAWDAWVSPQGLPTRATVQAKLAGAEFDVEIVVTAAV
jgi:enamine deaminase RidA (YjgF/YER057c/UK114 family)